MATLPRGGSGLASAETAEHLDSSPTANVRLMFGYGPTTDSVGSSSSAYRRLPAFCHFRDRWGQRWPVYDGTQCPPVKHATYPFLWGGTRRRHRYVFIPGEDRELTPRALSLQRERAKYIPRHR